MAMIIVPQIQQYNYGFMKMKLLLKEDRRGEINDTLNLEILKFCKTKKAFNLL